MGVYCPCGVYVNATSENTQLQFVERCRCKIYKRTIKGRLSILADVCSTTLETSTLSLEYEDFETPSVNNFLFTANAITSVVCRRDGQDCVVTIKGNGSVKGRQFTFVAVFRDQHEQAFDILQKFVITGFFDLKGAKSFPKDSIKTLGCQTY
ncbi:hypothetical protein J6TS2_03680 [Heyndrickxia sporothermodurans]|nr:hypothetical protein J6TS2_03680 [Heyndrickxia sporothermodurans]